MGGNSAAAQLDFADIRVGDVFELQRVFTQQDVDDFARVSGDFSPLHVDPEYAATTEFGHCVVHGILLASLFSQLVGMRVPGKAALYLGQDLTFRHPARVGDPLRAIAKVTAKSDATRMLTLLTEIRTESNRILVSGTARVKVRQDARAESAQHDTRVVEAPPQAQRRPVALVTGGSRGIGAEIARTLASRGFAVGVVYFQSEAAATSVVQSIAAGGGVAIAVQGDVRESDSVARIVATVAQQLGPPTAVVNAAIGELGHSAAEDLSWQQFESQLEYQVKGVLQVCQAVLPHMKAAGGGAIVNLASQVVEGVPPSRMSDYVTAKSALVGLSRALAVEWAGQGVRVNTVSPGLVRTELTQHYDERLFRSEAMRTPLRRLATAADVASAVAYLLGEEGSFLTGTNLSVTGGQVMG
jgi:3-oxoacyl-[acyl-carrier protein] reductase